jgi:hypothetical protein
MNRITNQHLPNGNPLLQMMRIHGPETQQTAAVEARW